MAEGAIPAMAGKGPRGMLSVAQLREEVAEGQVETVVVGFTDMYGRLMGKRFDAEFFLETCVRPGGGTHACNYLLALDIDMEPVEGYKFASWEQGCELLLLLPAHARGLFAEVSAVQRPAAAPRGRGG